MISRNFRYPSAELRDRVRQAVKERGFRSEQAFILAACENELERGDGAEATAQLEARIAATLEIREASTVALHSGTRTVCPHQFPVAVPSDLRG